MSVATELPPEVHIPRSARPCALRLAPISPGPVSLVQVSPVQVSPVQVSPVQISPRPAAPAAAAIGAEVFDLDRWRHQFRDGDARELARAIARHPANGHVRSRVRCVRPTGRVQRSAVGLRLTTRGVMVLTVLVALALVGGAWFSAPSGAQAGTGAGGAATTSAVVTVKDGDSLWSIAQVVAPTRDPRAEVDRLRQLNHLGDDSLAPGQTLRTR